MKIRNFNTPIDFSYDEKIENYNHAYNLFNQEFFSDKKRNTKKSWSFWDEIHSNMRESFNQKENLINFQSCKQIAPTICGNGGEHFFEKLEDNFGSGIINKYLKFYVENLVGTPPDITTHNGIFITKTAMRHLYYLILLKENLGIISEQENSFVEIGGGFGNLCKLSNDFNLSKQYIIIDLPEMLLVQYFYLSHFFNKSEIAVINQHGEFVEGNNKSKVILLHPSQTSITKSLINYKSTLISTVALTEIDPKTQMEYLNEIPFEHIYIYGQKKTLGREGGKAYENVLNNENLMLTLFESYHCVFYEDRGYYFEYFGKNLLTND